MDQNMLSERWSHLREDVLKTWTRFTDNDVEEINGNYDILISKLQEKYNYTTQQARQEVEHFLALIGQQAEHFHL